jgi:hypothetical protein
MREWHVKHMENTLVIASVISLFFTFAKQETSIVALLVFEEFLNRGYCRSQEYTYGK